MENGKCGLEKDDIVVNKDNASRGIYVTGFPSNTTASELVIHFQKRKYGGGDIECLHITEERFAVIIFDDPSVAESVVKKRQVLSPDNVPLKVDLLSVRKVSGEKMFVEKFLRDSQKEDLIDWTAQEAGAWCQNGTDEDDENFESEDQLEHNLDANTLSKKEHHRGPDGASIPQVQVRSDIEQMRQALDDEKRTRDVRKHELKEKEKLLLSQLENALGEEKQKRARLEEELSRVKNAGNERARTLENRLRDTFRLYELKKAEVREKVAAVDKLQVLLEENQQEKSEIKNQLSQQQKFCTKLEERLKAEQLSIQELRLKVEQGREQKIALEQTVRRLQLQFTEEKDRHASIERDLQLALSTTQAEASELLRSGTRDWILLREEVTLGRKVLGKGAWGTVSEGTFRGCKVAVKEIHELILSDHNRRLFEREMNMASRCRHPNLLQFIGATNDDGSPLFISELLDTCLRRLLSERKLTPKEVLNLALDIAKALNYLHLNKPLPIIHRDISSANVLLWRRGECWRAKLSDYGAANFMQHCMTANTGAMIYSAPEAFTPKQSPKVDVYSFGVLLCEMCIREQPDPQGLSDQIKRVSDDTFRQLIRWCVEKEPDKRLTMAEVIPALEQC